MGTLLSCSLILSAITDKVELTVLNAILGGPGYGVDSVPLSSSVENSFFTAYVLKKTDIGDILLDGTPYRNVRAETRFSFFQPVFCHILLSKAT